ncbi:mechanosensitive ion channel family protein [Promicromonospora umidemergens]
MEYRHFCAAPPWRSKVTRKVSKGERTMPFLNAGLVMPLQVDWLAPLTNALGAVASFIPKLLVFLIVFLIGYFIAKAIARFVGMVLKRIGFTKVLEKAGANRLLAGSGIEPITLLTKIIYYFILLIALQLALSAFGPTNPVSAIVNDIVAWLPKLVVAIIIVVIAGAIANAVRDLLLNSMSRVSYGPLVAKSVSFFIIALGVIAAVNQIGIGTTVTMPVLVAFLATLAGILIVGVGGALIGPMRPRVEGFLGNLSSGGGATATPVAGHGTAPGATPRTEPGAPGPIAPPPRDI